MQLSQAQRDIIRCVQHRGSLSVQAIAKLLPYKTHVIRRSLDQLLQQHVIRKTILSDMYKLGYTPNNLHFSLAQKDPKFTEMLIEELRTHPQVSWFAEITGSHQFELTFLSRGVRDFTEFIDGLCDRFGDVFEEKSLAVELCHNYYGAKFISDTPIPVPTISFGECAETCTLDELDTALMRFLCERGSEPISTLARERGVSITTIAYRKERLKELGVLLEEVYFLDRNCFLPATYNLMLSVKNGDQKFREEFLSFCAAHPNFYCAHRCVGAWDYKIAILGENRESIVAALNQMKSRFSDNLAEVKVATIMREFKDDFFPFEPARDVGLRHKIEKVVSKKTAKQSDPELRLVSSETNSVARKSRR